MVQRFPQRDLAVMSQKCWCSSIPHLRTVLHVAADWQERQVIAVCDYDSDFVKAFNSPVIIIDPVDSRRNLGSAISPQSVAKFMLAC